MKNEIIDKDTLAQKEAKAAKSKKKSSDSSVNSIVQILNGDFLNKEFVLNNLSYMFYILFLLLLLIGKGYYGKQLAKDAEKAQNKLNELSADYLEVKAKLEEETRREKLIEKLGDKGLVETINPTKVIRIKKEKESK
ncbi:MAG: FtsL-like putative cell division protein [Crocinitomicaceae bacterium]